MKTKLNMTKADMHLQILRHNNATINTKNIARLVGLYDIEPGDRYKLLYWPGAYTGHKRYAKYYEIKSQNTPQFSSHIYQQSFRQPHFRPKLNPLQTTLYNLQV